MAYGKLNLVALATLILLASTLLVACANDDAAAGRADAGLG